MRRYRLFLYLIEHYIIRFYIHNGIRHLNIETLYKFVCCTNRQKLFLTIIIIVIMKVSMRICTLTPITFESFELSAPNNSSLWPTLSAKLLIFSTSPILSLNGTYDKLFESHRLFSIAVSLCVISLIYREKWVVKTINRNLLLN